jgi:hypothetical protein
MDDDFKNLDNWNHEVQLNGFGYIPLVPLMSTPTLTRLQYRLI